MTTQFLRMMIRDIIFDAGGDATEEFVHSVCRLFILT